jgi:hypothetical protein
VECVHYPLDRALAPAGQLQLRPEDLFIFVNYFGLMGHTANAFAARLGSRVVLDDAQAFFHRPPSGSWSFNSARKFFGVPDGAYLFGPSSDMIGDLPPAKVGIEHLLLRVSGELERGYKAFQHHESQLAHEARTISEAASDLMARIDYAAVAKRRRANYLALDELLGERSLLRPTLSADDVPIYYPLLVSKPLRGELIRRGVFVPCLWPEVISRAGGLFAWERELAALLCPLPVDQRYDPDAMQEIASRVVEALDS